jgi:hypothetical protein
MPWAPFRIAPERLGEKPRAAAAADRDPWTSEQPGVL